MVYTSAYEQQVTEESGITSLHYQGQELHFFYVPQFIKPFMWKCPPVCTVFKSPCKRSFKNFMSLVHLFVFSMTAPSGPEPPHSQGV
jgi:hypothetical protein